MPTIHFTDRVAGRISPGARALAKAAIAALGAPSIFNTQPWRWTIRGEVAELRADRTRQLAVVDPDGRLLTLSCGAALHHARVALAVAGVGVTVDHLPDPDDPDLLATISYDPGAQTEPPQIRLYRAMTTRQTDRRPFTEQPVPGSALDTLRPAAESCGAHLHLLRPEQVVTLTVAAGHAATRELADPAYRAELARWVHHAGPEGEGVPTATATAAPGAARPVPIRDFTATGPERTTIHDPIPLADRYARYAVLFTDGDTPHDWLTAGQALSAVLLTATAEGLATSPMSDLVEVAASRALLRDLLGGIGHPAIAIRLGLPATSGMPAAAPRRATTGTVHIVAPAGDGPDA